MVPSLLGGIDEILFIKYLGWCLAHNKYSVLESSLTCLILISQN